jgi:hypothetical protein
MAINPGNNLNSVGAPLKQTLSSNYIDFTDSTVAGWAQQYLPDLMEGEAEVFGNRTISGFLAQVGAEEAMASDQVIWSEQGRLHLAYNITVADVDDFAGSNAGNGGGEITIGNDIDGQTAGANHAIRVNDTVLIAQSTGICRALVTAVDGATVSVAPYGVANLGAAGITAAAAKLLVYGSEFAKGTSGRSDAATPQFKTFTNKPIILKDYYEISGSDVSQVGWVEVTGEDGQAGYYWYLKAEGDVRSRFSDYCEMAMLESVKPVAGSLIDNTAIGSDTIPGGVDPNPAPTLTGANFSTEGLFAAIEDRGNVTTGVNGINAATDLAEFDAILAEFDNQGAIEENMMFVNRATSLAIDDMLASMNSYGAGGTSYGVFNNSEDMALNLGFSGFRRGSYDFYKSDFRYLNDKATRKTINDEYAAGAIRGVIIPAGVSSVYDQALGKNLKRPFLHVRYRASQMEDRKMKSWITGSVGGNVTSSLDAMQVHFLSERCLVVQGANNFMLMK